MAESRRRERIHTGRLDEPRRHLDRVDLAGFIGADAVLVPALSPNSGLVHRKISFNERPAITLAANVTVRDGKIERARLAVGSIGIAAQRLTGAEESLHGLDASDPRRTHLDQCLEVAGREAEPVQDANGSIEYKRQLVRVLVERCVREALLEAQAP